MRKAFQDAIAAFQSEKVLDPSKAIADLKKTMSILDQKYQQDAAEAGNKSPSLPAGPGESMKYKLPDGDRLEKLGLFIGGSPATPGLSEARRTANATEQSLKQLNVLTNLLGRDGLKTTTIARYQ
jgi:hypothetical protein